MQDVAAAAHQRLGGEDDGLADEEVFGVLEWRAGDRDDRAGQLVEVGVAAVSVLGVLDHAEDPAGEASVEGGEGRGEVAADIQQYDRLAGGAGLDVVQGGVGIGEQFAGQGVAGTPARPRAGLRVDGLRLGQHRAQAGDGGDRPDEAGRSGSRWVIRNDAGCSVGANWAAILAK